MWPSDDFSQCPKCGEITREFDRHFPDLITHPRGVYYPVLAYYCPHCDHVVVEVFYSDTDRDVLTCARDADWRVAAPSDPPRPHPAYDSERISFRAVLSHSSLEFHRSVRQQIGRVVRPDDPEVDLQIPTPFDFDTEQVRSTLHTWLRNSKSGTASKATANGSHVTIHLTVSNHPRLRAQLDRLRRRFPLPTGTKLYYFNEGRRYAGNDVG